jgi:hypothetical protein
MKKNIATLIIMIISIFSFGQRTTEVYFGLNRSGIYPSSDQIQMSSSQHFGFNAGMSVTYKLNKIFSLQPGVSIDQVGGKLLEIPTKKGSDYFLRYGIQSTNISIPVFLNIYPLPTYNTKVHFFLQLGLSGGFNIWMNVKSQLSYGPLNFQGPNTDSPFEASFRPGAGILFGDRISLILRRNIGLIDLLDYPTEKYMISGTSLIVQYRVGKK